MKLFHFTSLLNLPDIVRDGITKGEVPISPSLPYCERPSGANLTTNGNPADQSIWAGEGMTDKTAIRLTVDLPESELTSFREVKERYQIRSSWLKLIAPYEHRCHWYFAFGGIRPEQIGKFERRSENGYETLTTTELAELVEKIQAEIEQNLIVAVMTSGFNKGARAIGLKDGSNGSWLLDGKYSSHV